MLNIFMHGLATFIDLIALSSVVGTVLCLFWTMCPSCDNSSICANTCFDRWRRLLFFCLIGLSMSSLAMLVQRTMEMAGLGITEITPLLPTVLFSSHYGSMWFIRTASIVIAWCVWWIGKRHLNSRIVIFLLLSACAAIAFSRSASSHAADYGDLSLQQLSDWFHLMAAISWGGALLSISLMLSASTIAESSDQQHIVAGIADRFFVLFGPVCRTRPFRTLQYLGGSQVLRGSSDIALRLVPFGQAAYLRISHIQIYSPSAEGKR